MGVKGFLDKIPVSLISQFEKQWIHFLQISDNTIIEEIRIKKTLSTELLTRITNLATSFKTSFITFIQKS